MNLHTTWDRSRRHTDRESLLSSDEEGPILSWSKPLSYSTSVEIITPDKCIIVRLSSILWIKVDLRSSNKVICSLYSSLLSSDSSVSVPNDDVFFSNSNKIEISLNVSFASSCDYAILRISFNRIDFTS